MNSRKPSDFQALLAFLAYLFANRQERARTLSSSERVLMRLITIVGIVLIALALVMIGAPEKIADVLQYVPVGP